MSAPSCIRKRIASARGTQRSKCCRPARELAAHNAQRVPPSDAAGDPQPARPPTAITAYRSGP